MILNLLKIHYPSIFTHCAGSIFILTASCSLIALTCRPLPVWAKTELFAIHIASFKSFENAAREIFRVNDHLHSGWLEFSAGGGKRQQHAGASSVAVETGREAPGFIQPIKESRLHAFHRYEAVKGKGNYYRVYVGIFSNSETAQNIGLGLRKKGLISYFKPIKIDRHNKCLNPKQIERFFVPAEKKKKKRKDIRPEPLVMAEDEKNSSPTSFKTRPSFSNRAKELRINKPDSYETDKLKTGKDTSLQLASIPSEQTKTTISIYGGVEKIKADGLDLNFLMVGPKFSFDLLDRLSLYCKAGAVYGNFDGYDSSGNFENIKGWESALGFEMSKSRIRFGFDFLYRDIEFDYKTQNKSLLSINRTSIDYSSYSIIGSLSFSF